MVVGKSNMDSGRSNIVTLVVGWLQFGVTKTPMHDLPSSKAVVPSDDPLRCISAVTGRLSLDARPLRDKVWLVKNCNRGLLLVGV